MNHAARPAPTPAEEAVALLTQLWDRVDTREEIPRYRRVRRGAGREVAVIDFAIHRTHEPGLLTQLGIIVSAPANGIVVPGAALPGGSPGWDADGCLAPLTGGGKPDAAEPVADAWHVADEIRRDLYALLDELHADGHKGGLVSIATDDEKAAQRVVQRLRGLVQRARIAAAYDAPIVPLRDICCPLCGGEMRVRADASSAVWCAGAWKIRGPALPGEPWPVIERCGARWPRGSWVALLEEAG